MRKVGSRQTKARPTEASARVIPCKAAWVNGPMEESDSIVSRLVAIRATLNTPNALVSCLGVRILRRLRYKPLYEREGSGEVSPVTFHRRRLPGRSILLVLRFDPQVPDTSAGPVVFLLQRFEKFDGSSPCRIDAPRTSLESHLPSKLYLTGAVGCVIYYPEFRIINGGVWRAEDRVIEGIFSFEAHLKIQPLM